MCRISPSMGLEAFLSTKSGAGRAFGDQQVILMSVTTDSEATDLCERARSLDETDTRYFWLKLLGIVSLSESVVTLIRMTCLIQNGSTRARLGGQERFKSHGRRYSAHLAIDGARDGPVSMMYSQQFPCLGRNFFPNTRPNIPIQNLNPARKYTGSTVDVIRAWWIAEESYHSAIRSQAVVQETQVPATR